MQLWLSYFYRVYLLFILFGSILLKQLQNIILSRTDSIGDMVLTLPMAKVLKTKFPNCTIAVLGKPYTRAVVEACGYIDSFIEMDEFVNGSITIKGEAPQAIVFVKPDAHIAKRAKELHIPKRIGVANRLYNWFTCNQLVFLSRKQSDLHEAQLNLKLLKPFGINKAFSYEEIGNLYGLNRLQPLEQQYSRLIQKEKYNLILHPKSRGNAREWSLTNYIQLIKELDPSRYNIFVSGTQSEIESLQPLFDEMGNRVTNLVGAMPLAQFLSFISQCNGLVACSTGPLHVAAAVGIHAFGLYVPLRPIHAGRWGPIGKHAHTFIADGVCGNCTATDTSHCTCLQSITPAKIKAAIEASAIGII
ncbi:MAG: glycosyltransferase family 9 protein [Bacteroidota bacterium]|nr:glycosyltransferase family 9 protein [Bacteroidota bacterium]